MSATTDWSLASASDIAGAVSTGRVGARDVVAAAFDRIARIDPAVNSFTDRLAARAIARAADLDAARARGDALGPLAGVPFAVKNLFDVAGLPTRAGSRINRERAPATRDAALVRRLEAAGAVLVGTLGMGEYAYDFTGENIHDGNTRNPHALGHMSGGSSGGSGAAVAAGLVPVALASDTNGSIRVPAAFCGCFGLKPTYGRLSRAGSFPFVGSLDHLGPMARSSRDLALAYDAMQGPDPEDPAVAPRPVEPAVPDLDRGVADLRIAVAGDYFAQGGDPEAFAAVAHVARALGVTRSVTIPEAARARAAAYLITAAEGAALHLDRLRARAGDFDPAVRDRLIAGAMLPAPFVERAQIFPPLVSRRRAGTVPRGRRDPRAEHAGPGAALRPDDLCAGRRRVAGAAQYRRVHAADLLHRPARGRGAGLARRRPAARRAGHRRALERGALPAGGASPRTRGRGPGAGRDLEGDVMFIDDPAVKAEVEQVFATYEAALVNNDVATLERLFHDDPRTIRYGAAENLYGMDAIRAFRRGRPAQGLARDLSGTVITTFGRDCAVAMTLFRREGAPGRVGRQSQTWLRFPDGWKVVAAHVSVIDDAPGEGASGA